MLLLRVALLRALREDGCAEVDARRGALLPSPPAPVKLAREGVAAVVLCGGPDAHDGSAHEVKRRSVGFGASASSQLTKGFLEPPGSRVVGTGVRRDSFVRDTCLRL